MQVADITMTSMFTVSNLLPLPLLSRVGLAARVADAAQAGMTTPANQPVNSADELKESIVRFLCSPPNGGSDLGARHDIIQFLPIHHMLDKMNTLLLAHPFLRHHGGPNGQHEQAADVVDYAQVLTITRANAAVGPVDMPIYFNM